MRTDFKNIDEYISSYPEETQKLLKRIRATIQDAAPDATEIINYGMPTFTLNGNLVHFAAFKNHIGFYPTPSAIEAFKSEIEKYVWAKGSVQFPMNEPIPYSLIERIVKFRVSENSGKKKKNK